MAIVSRQDVDRSLEDMLVQMRPRIRATFARFRVPEQDAEDLLQQSLLTYLHKEQSINDPELWLLGTLRYSCLVYWRTKRRSVYQAVDRALLEGLAQPQAPRQDNDDLKRDLDCALSALPSRCRSVLEQRYTYGCEPAETAKQLGYKSSSIYKVIERCLAALSRQIRSHETGKGTSHG